jgi:hypothetical protein
VPRGCLSPSEHTPTLRTGDPREGDRWSLLSLDRLEGGGEGATEGALKLKSAGLIDYTRGRIRVLDRQGLEKRTCECNAVVKTIITAALFNIGQPYRGPSSICRSSNYADGAICSISGARRRWSGLTLRRTAARALKRTCKSCI